LSNGGNGNNSGSRERLHKPCHYKTERTRAPSLFQVLLRRRRSNLNPGQVLCNRCSSFVTCKDLFSSSAGILVPSQVRCKGVQSRCWSCSSLCDYSRLSRHSVITTQRTTTTHVRSSNVHLACPRHSRTSVLWRLMLILGDRDKRHSCPFLSLHLSFFLCVSALQVHFHPRLQTVQHRHHRCRLYTRLLFEVEASRLCLA
jgi:hypothetical protein